MTESVTPTTRPPLRRLPEERIVAGVCAGLARRLGLSVHWVRALFVIGTLIPVLPGLPLYLLFWLFVPRQEPSSGGTATEPEALDDERRAI